MTRYKIQGLLSKGLVDVLDLNTQDWHRVEVNGDGLKVYGIRIIPALPKDNIDQRDIIRLLSKMKWSLDQITGLFSIYSEEFLNRILRQPIQTDKAKKKSQTIREGQEYQNGNKQARVCPCGCNRRLSGNRKYARSYCRQKKYRSKKVA